MKSSLYDKPSRDFVGQNSYTALTVPHSVLMVCHMYDIYEYDTCLRLPFVVVQEWQELLQ